MLSSLAVEKQLPTRRIYLRGVQILSEIVQDINKHQGLFYLIPGAQIVRLSWRKVSGYTKSEFVG